MADDLEDAVPSPEPVAAPPPSRRARMSILMVALIAYFLLACMVLAVALVIAARLGWLP